MTRSALTSTFGGIVSPICFAVFKFMNNSNFVGNSVGTSAGFAPFRILSTCTGIRLYSSVEAWPIGHEPTSFDRFLASEHAREPVLHRKLRDLRMMRVGYGVWKDQKSIGFLFDYCIESRANLCGVFYLIILKGGSQGLGRCSVSP